MFNISKLRIYWSCRPCFIKRETMGKKGMPFFLLLISSLLISKTICDDKQCPTCTCTCPTCDIATKAEGLTWTPIPNMGQCALGMSF